MKKLLVLVLPTLLQLPFISAGSVVQESVESEVPSKQLAQDLDIIKRLSGRIDKSDAAKYFITSQEALFESIINTVAVIESIINNIAVMIQDSSVLKTKPGFDGEAYIQYLYHKYMYLFMVSTLKKDFEAAVLSYVLGQNVIRSAEDAMFEKAQKLMPEYIKQLDEGMNALGRHDTAAATQQVVDLFVRMMRSSMQAYTATIRSAYCCDPAQKKDNGICDV